jgi:hypothetical protein
MIGRFRHGLAVGAGVSISGGIAVIVDSIPGPDHNASEREVGVRAPKLRDALERLGLNVLTNFTIVFLPRPFTRD